MRKNCNCSIAACNKHTKYLSFIFSVVSISAFFFLGICTIADSANTPFLKGETIHYDIEKFKLNVGEATLTFNGMVEVQGRKALSITFTANGFKFFDEEHIYIDQNTFYPILIKRHLKMFGKEEDIIEFYDAQKGKVRIVKTAKGESTEQTLENGGRFDNIYGFIYRHRYLGQFNQNKEYNLHLPTRDLKFQFGKQSQLKVADQNFDAVSMQSTPKKYEVWFDNSPKRIPLKINGALGFGKMAMIFKKLQ